MIEERGAGDGVTPGFGKAFGNGTGSMSDLEAKIKEGIENVFHHLLEVLVQLVGGLRQEKEEVDVRPGIQQATAVASIGYEGEGTGSLRLQEGAREKRLQQSVDDLGAQACYLTSSSALVVKLAEAGVLVRHVFLVKGEPLIGGDFHQESGVEDPGNGIRERLGRHGITVNEAGENEKSSAAGSSPGSGPAGAGRKPPAGQNLPVTLSEPLHQFPDAVEMDAVRLVFENPLEVWPCLSGIADLQVEKGAV